MGIRNAQFKALEKTWTKFVGGVGIIGGLYGLWSAWGAWGIVIMLGLLLGLLVYLLFGGSYVPVRFICENEELRKELTKLLKETKKSLYYYGGAGFIGDYQDWREQYDLMLENENIVIVRFLDLKSTQGMKEILKTGMKQDELKDEIDAYTKWLETHSGSLESRIKNNCFFDFEGAPIWKYGLHCVIFDNKHVVFPIYSNNSHSAIIIKDCPDMATTITESFDYLQRVFNLAGKSKDDLAAMAETD